MTEIFMVKKRVNFRFEQELIDGIKVLASVKRWDQTTVLEVAIEEYLKSEGILDDKNKLTDHALEILKNLTTD